MDICINNIFINETDNVNLKLRLKLTVIPKTNSFEGNSG